jgi:tRNA G18 (ribose-2'-O)-methylase SpoU
LATPDPIVDATDPRLEPFVAVRERDLVGRRGAFVAEGEVVVRTLLETQAKTDRFVIETILVSERVAAHGRPWFAAIPAGTLFVSAPDDVIAAASGFHVHRGILALARRRDPPTLAALLAGLPPRALVVACIGLANHDNMGGVFRNAAAFGADAVLCDAACCDPLYRKAIRVSVGGVFRVPFARDGDAGGIVDALFACGFDVVALSPAGAATIDAMSMRDRLALIVGAEGPGLPDDILARVRTARIAMAGGFDSLNVAVSAGIALHHAFKR